ncbi:spore germination protein [Radiobacillus deserti]|uniref:Spore germination protein n=1 Tax=Radiobacillus deserti TaxID=2594883 RepID=A0A516KE29_9BACI|nr:spore germination protein [Radiobacillus deserti]QDP39655.1 hypothetical protein FN924_05360 [Radiobacillus deserti]
MVLGYENENYPIVVGGVSVNNVDGNGSINFGETVFQSAHAPAKLNFNGQVYGQNNIIHIQPMGSPIYDPDLFDNNLPVGASPMGLED